MSLWQAVLILLVTAAVPAVPVVLAVQTWRRRRNERAAAERDALWEPHVEPNIVWAGGSGNRAVLDVTIRKTARYPGGSAAVMQVCPVRRVELTGDDAEAQLQVALTQARVIAESLNTARYAPLPPLT